MATIPEWAKELLDKARGSQDDSPHKPWASRYGDVLSMLQMQRLVSRDFAGLLIEECERLRTELDAAKAAKQDSLAENDLLRAKLSAAKQRQQDSLAEALVEIERTHGYFSLHQGRSGGGYSGHGELKKGGGAVILAEWEGGFSNGIHAILASIKPKPTAADARAGYESIKTGHWHCGDWDRAMEMYRAAVERWEAEEKGGAE